MIEELKSKHKIEIDTLNSAVKHNSADLASQELKQTVTEYKQQVEEAKEIIILKNNTVKT